MNTTFTSIVMGILLWATTVTLVFGQVTRDTSESEILEAELTVEHEASDQEGDSVPAEVDGKKESATGPAAFQKTYAPTDTNQSPHQQLDQLNADYEASRTEAKQLYVQELKALRRSALDVEDFVTIENITQRINKTSQKNNFDDLEIISATWGVRRHTVNVPQRIKLRGNTASIPVHVNTLGDPAKGSPKFLDVVFEFHENRLTLRLPEVTGDNRLTTATLSIEVISE